MGTESDSNEDRVSKTKEQIGIVKCEQKVIIGIKGYGGYLQERVNMRESWEREEKKQLAESCSVASVLKGSHDSQWVGSDDKPGHRKFQARSCSPKVSKIDVT